MMPVTAILTGPERTEIALKYAALGLKIQPIHSVASNGLCSCGNSQCKSPGKHPRTPSGYMDASSDEMIIRGWISRWPKCNIGLTMGQIVVSSVSGESRRLIALDIDPRNGGDEGFAELERKHGKLPDTATQLTQSGGYHYLFYAPVDATFPGLLAPGVEVKTKNHINVYPSVGPKGSYEWEASADLLEGFGIAEAPEWLIEKSSQRIDAPLVAASPAYTAPQTFADLKEALPFIPADDYEVWIKVGQALKTLGNQGFGLWNNWSQLSTKYDAKSMRPKWDSFQPNQINVESIFHLAEQNGWINSARAGQSSFDEMAWKANFTPKIVPKTDPRPDLRFPEAGAQSLEAVAMLLQAGGNVRNADAGRMAAMMLLSHASGRGYITEFGEPVQVYGVLCAPSIGEIGHFKSTLFSLFESAGINGARHLRADSTQAIYQYLHRYPALLNVISDFGQKLYHARRQYSNTLDQAFTTMAEVYDGKDMKFDPSEYGIKPAGKVETFKIYHPALTMFGLMSEDRVPYFLSTQELGRGSLEQYLFVYASPDKTELSEPQVLVTPTWLVDHLKRIRAEPPVTDHSSVAVASEEPANERVVRFGVRPDSCYAHIMTVSDHPLARNLLIAARGQVRRVAALLAIWNNPETPIVSKDDLDYAVRYVVSSLQTMLERLRLMGNDDGALSTQQKVAAFIHKAGKDGVLKNNLQKFCWAYKKMSAEDRYNMIHQMIEDGDIVEHETSNKRGSKYISTSFVDLEYPSKLSGVEAMEMRRGSVENAPLHLEDAGDVAFSPV